MKYPATLVALVTLPVTVFGQAATAPGGEASGSGGTASFSIGQAVYTNMTELGGSVNQGVQQPYEVFKLSMGVSVTLASVFPNPTASGVTVVIDAADASNLSFRLLDMEGRLVHSGTLNWAETTIDMQSLAAGSYVLSVTGQDQVAQSFEIIKN
jgi:hypothetical protein